MSLNNLGSVTRVEGDYDTACSLLEESLAINRELGSRQGIAHTLSNLGLVAYYRCDYSAARSLHQESLELRRELGDKQGTANSLVGLGDVANNEGCSATSRSFYREGLALYRELGDRLGIARALEAVARLDARDHNYGKAAGLWGAAERLREEIGSPFAANERDAYERDVTASRQAMGEEAFGAALEKGRAMTMEQAIQHALEEPDTQPSNLNVLARPDNGQ